MKVAVRIWIVSVLMFVPAVAFAEFDGAAGETPEGDVEALTIGDAIERAREHSHDVRLGEVDVERAAVATREARTGRLPELTLEGQYVNNLLLPVIVLPEDSPFGEQILETGNQHNFDAGVQASVPLYSARLNRNIELSRIAEEVETTLQEATVREIEIEVQRAYLNGLIARRNLEVLRESRRLMRENLQLVEAMYEEDAAPEYDLIRIEVQVANMEPELTSAANGYREALNYLKLLTGISIDRPVHLEVELEEYFESLPPADFEAQFDDNRRMLEIEGQRRLADQQVDVERAAYLPTLSAFGNFNYQGQGDDLAFWDYEWVDTATVGVGLSIPLFSAGRRQRVEQARAELRQVHIQRDLLRRSLHSEFATTSNRIEALEQTIAAQRRNIEQAERGLEIATVSYEEGAYSLMDVHDAEEALTEARLNYAGVLGDYIDAVLDMEELLGRGATATEHQ